MIGIRLSIDRSVDLTSVMVRIETMLVDCASVRILSPKNITIGEIRVLIYLARRAKLVNLMVISLACASC